MKTFEFSETTVPNFIIMGNGDIVFYDYPHLWGFEVGDRLEFKTRLGVSCFEVIEADPANLPSMDSNLRKIRATKRGS